MTHWPKEDYGKFYNGDSYILLNTYKEAGGDVSSNYNIKQLMLLLFFIQELKYDLHFWIGQYSSQDEYGTAAYKTVELDTLVGRLLLVLEYCIIIISLSSLMTSRSSIVR